MQDEVIKNKKKNKIISFLIVIILITASIVIAINFDFFYKEDEDKSPLKETIIDDRISPYTEQALFLEIKRIRAKGVIEKMTDTGPLVKRLNDLDINNKGQEFPILSKIAGVPVNGYGITALIKSKLPGIGWDEKPNFYYGAVIDDFEWNSGKRKFTGWDTGYIFDEPYKVVEEEQEKSDVEILIFNTGDDKPVERCKVLYDYRLGTWSGDDYFNDSDGYGHFNGTDFEFWFDIRQTDKDGDMIPFWTEVNILKTNPKVDDRDLDPDDDKCSTAWEWKWGYDPFTWDNHTFLDPDNDGLQNIEEEYMYKWLANPYQPEIYIEVDFSEDAPDLRPFGFIPYKIEMKPGKILPIKRPTIEKVKFYGQEVILFEESKAMLIERFNEHGISMHFDDGCMGEGGETLDLIGPVEIGGIHPNDYVISNYYKKNFPDERKGVFRYIVLVVLAGGWNYNMDYKGRYDTICVSATDIFFDQSKSPRSQRVVQAVALLHELGHSCGYGYLHCGGVDNLTAEGAAETWYNYKSAMNYYWYGAQYFDYSHGNNGPNDCDDWAKIDVGYFQRAPRPYDLEGIDFDFAEPPINRR